MLARDRVGAVAYPALDPKYDSIEGLTVVSYAQASFADRFSRRI